MSQFGSFPGHFPTLRVGNMFEKNENRSTRRPRWEALLPVLVLLRLKMRRGAAPSLADPGPSPDDFDVFEPYL